MRQSESQSSARPVLVADTEWDLMDPHPVCISVKATVMEACRLLTEKRFRASPVIDEVGQSVGATDIVILEREKIDTLPPAPDDYDQSDLPSRRGLGMRFSRSRTSRSRCGTRS